MWALAALKLDALRVRALWWYIAAAEVFVFVAVILGVAHRNADDVTPSEFHELYGFSGLFAIGILYGYRQQLKDRRYELYGLGSLFIMGLGIRAMVLHR